MPKKTDKHTIEITGIQPGSNVGIIDVPKKELIVAFHCPVSEIVIEIENGQLLVLMRPEKVFASTSFTLGLFDRFFRRQKKLRIHIRKTGFIPAHIDLMPLKDKFSSFRIATNVDTVYYNDDEDKPPYASSGRSYT